MLPSSSDTPELLPRLKRVAQFTRLRLTWPSDKTDETEADVEEGGGEGTEDEWNYDGERNGGQAERLRYVVAHRAGDIDLQVT